jgi:hypothetical protein
LIWKHNLDDRDKLFPRLSGPETECRVAAQAMPLPPSFCDDIGSLGGLRAFALDATCQLLLPAHLDDGVFLGDLGVGMAGDL